MTRPLRLAVTVGLALLVAGFGAACVFDQGHYEGGGRADHGGEFVDLDASTPTDSALPPDVIAPDDDSGASPDVLLEAGDDADD